MREEVGSMKNNSLFNLILRWGGVLLLLLILLSCNSGPDSHTVTFSLDGGYFPEGYETTITIMDGSTLNGIPNPKKDSTYSYRYTFEGWYTDEACTEAYDFAAPVTADLTLYAKWEAVHTHTVTLVEGKSPTCTQPGTKAYYVCECGAAFEDEAMTKPIADLDTWKVIPAKGHNFENGVCTVCGEKDPDYTEPTEPTDPSEPTNPTDPSEPTKPTDPSEPTKPTETTKPATEPEGPDQTGELASPFLLMALLLTSAACVAVMWVRLRKEKAN